MHHGTRRQGALTSFFPRNKPLLPLPTDVPPPQASLENHDTDSAWRSGNHSSAPDAGYATPGETSAIQPADGHPTDPELQRSGNRDPVPTPTTQAFQALAVTTEKDPAFRERPQTLHKNADFRGTLNTDTKPPNRARRFLRNFFQMVTNNRAVLMA